MTSASAYIKNYIGGPKAAGKVISQVSASQLI